MINPDVSFNGVYYVESSISREPVAIRPHLKNHFMEWGDTSRGSHVELDSIKFTPSPREQPGSIPEKIEILSKRGEKLTLIFLSLELYNNKVKKRVAGRPEFNSQEELQNYYLNTNFQAY